MSYKMLVLDLDDTLLRDDLTISSKTREAILAAQSYGATVVIATGRPTYACISIAKEIGLDKYGGFVISFNGAVITNVATGHVLREVNITKENVYALYQLSQELGSHILTYMNNKIITPKNNEYIEIEKKLTSMPIVEVEDFVSFIDRNVPKAILLQEPTYLKWVAEQIRPRIPSGLNMTFSKPFFLEFMNENVDKALSVSLLADYLGIDLSSVIAVGDGYNDISMIKCAGLGVAMGNSVDKVKEASDYITHSNMEDGVAEIIYRFMLVTRIADQYRPHGGVPA